MIGARERLQGLSFGETRAPLLVYTTRERQRIRRDMPSLFRTTVNNDQLVESRASVDRLARFTDYRLRPKTFRETAISSVSPHKSE